MIEITDYQSLLAVGRQQANPQRFLFVFLQASLPAEHNEADRNKFHAGQGGELQAIMCVDKDLDELTDFKALVAESEQMEQDWSMVLIGCLDGHNGMHPSSADAEQPLKMMVQTVQNGGDLSKYLAFDKHGVLLHFA